MITPKISYIKENSKQADSIYEITNSPNFKRAAEAALLQYILGLDMSLPTTGIRISGAKGFLEELMSMVENPSTTQFPDDQLIPI